MIENKKKDLLKGLALMRAISWKDNYIVLLDNIKITLFPCRAWAVTLENLKKKSNEEYVYNLGYLYGVEAFKVIKKRVTTLKFNIADNYLEFPSILEVSGIGKVDYMEGKSNIKKISFLEHEAIKESIRLFGENASAITFYAGAVSAFHNLYFNKDEKFRGVVEGGTYYFIKDGNN